MLICESCVGQKAVGQAVSQASESQSLFPAELCSFLRKFVLPDQKWSLCRHLNPARGDHAAGTDLPFVFCEEEAEPRRGHFLISKSPFQKEQRTACHLLPWSPVNTPKCSGDLGTHVICCMPLDPRLLHVLLHHQLLLCYWFHCKHQTLLSASPATRSDGCPSRR